MSVEKRRDTTSALEKWRWVGRCEICRRWTLPFFHEDHAAEALAHHQETKHPKGGSRA